MKSQLRNPLNNPRKKNKSMLERLQKVLAQAGLGSRREVEKWIEAGRVSVDGKIVGLGTKVDEKQIIRVDGKIVKTQGATQSLPRVLAYNKPEGEICSRNDPEGRPSVFQHLPKLHSGKWIMIGRLDINTAGLLLFTTDGELAHRMTHPSYEVEREYAVRVFGELPDKVTETLRQGVQLEDGPANFDSIKMTGGEGLNKWFNVTLKEGRNREVRRIWETQGLQVSRLLRTRYGDYQLPKSLKKGNWRELTGKEINGLRANVNLKTLAFKTHHDDDVKKQRERHKNYRRKK